MATKKQVLNFFILLLTLCAAVQGKDERNDMSKSIPNRQSGSGTARRVNFLRRLEDGADEDDIDEAEVDGDADEEDVEDEDAVEDADVDADADGDVDADEDADEDAGDDFYYEQFDDDEIERAQGYEEYDDDDDNDNDDASSNYDYWDDDKYKDLKDKAETYEQMAMDEFWVIYNNPPSEWSSTDWTVFGTTLSLVVFFLCCCIGCCISCCASADEDHGDSYERKQAYRNYDSGDDTSYAATSYDSRETRDTEYRRFGVTFDDETMATEYTAETQKSKKKSGKKNDWDHSVMITRST